jgi:hypothetical protein
MREPVDRFSRRLPWAALALVFLAVACVRVRLLGAPLERDEGEYAYIGSLLLHGIAPWAEAWNMKLPGVYAVYAILIGVGGPSVTAIHAGLWLASAWSSAACALLGKRLLGDAAAVVAGAAYAALSVSTAVLGLWAHAEQFAVGFALAGLWLALEPRSRAALAGAGLLLSLAVLVKQNAAPLALFGALWVTALEVRRRPRAPRESFERLAAFAAAALLPMAVTALALLRAGVFERFWFWTVTYAATYGAQASAADGWTNLAETWLGLLRTQLVWWLCAGAGVTAVLWSSEVRARAAFLLGLFAAGCISASLGFYFRPQYFVLLLPAVALLAGAGVHALAPRSPRARAIAVSAVALLGLVTPLGVEWKLFLRATPEQVTRAIYGANPFVEAPVIAREIAKRTLPDARIAVIGSEPEIYFYSGRRAATGYVYTYPLMEPQPYAARMQQEMIDQIDAAKPEILVFVNVDISWLARPESPRTIAEWFDRISRRDYETLGYADMLSSVETHYVFDEEARTYAPRSPYYVWLLRRRPS